VVGASLGFWTGDAVEDMVWSCCFAAASAPEFDKGHMVAGCAVCGLRLFGARGSVVRWELREGVLGGM
jgi:hypothetical protein